MEDRGGSSYLIPAGHRVPGGMPMLNVMGAMNGGGRGGAGGFPPFPNPNQQHAIMAAMGRAGGIPPQRGGRAAMEGGRGGALFVPPYLHRPIMPVSVSPRGYDAKRREEERERERKRMRIAVEKRKGAQGVAAKPVATRICLRACYAMPGTDMAYRPTRVLPY